MISPGSYVGPMRLPVSYSKAQLEYFGWNGSEFTKVKRVGWCSRINEERGHQVPRPRYWDRKDLNK